MARVFATLLPAAEIGAYTEFADALGVWFDDIILDNKPIGCAR